MNKRQIIATVILGMAIIYITLFAFQTGNKAKDDFNKGEWLIFAIPLGGLVVHFLRDGSKDEMLKLKRFWKKHWLKLILLVGCFLISISLDSVLPSLIAVPLYIIIVILIVSLVFDRIKFEKVEKIK